MIKCKAYLEVADLDESEAVEGYTEADCAETFAELTYEREPTDYAMDDTFRVVTRVISDDGMLLEPVEWEVAMDWSPSFFAGRRDLSND